MIKALILHKHNLHIYLNNSIESHKKLNSLINEDDFKAKEKVKHNW